MILDYKVVKLAFLNKKEENIMIVNLKALKELIEENTNLKVSIEQCYIDFGANWISDTLIVHNDDGSSYQLLSPMDVQHINKGKFTSYETEQLINQINQKNK